VAENDVQRLWEEHQATAFPERLGGREIAGVDMVLLDADVAGYVTAWLGTGSLDDERRAMLVESLNDLDRVLPRLEFPAEREYYERLQRLAQAALA
jgi:hypothetical protein